MGKNHYDQSAFAKKLFEQGNEIAGFRLSDIMFSGSEADLKQTNVTQPAIFLHSVIAYKTVDNARPEMVAGHSLGEFSALVANSVLSFEDGMRLVIIRSPPAEEPHFKSEPWLPCWPSDARVRSSAARLNLKQVKCWCRRIITVHGQVVISGSLKGLKWVVKE
jgi:[acyl-carrier-protein] S-malonyltransferase